MTKVSPFFKIALFGTLLVLGLFACKKPEDLQKSEEVMTESLETPVEGFMNHDGVLAAVTVVEYYPTDSGERSVARPNEIAAAFYSKGPSLPYLDAGKLKLDTVSLDFNQTTGFYELSKVKYPGGYYFNDAVIWNVGGNAKNQINPEVIQLNGFADQPHIDSNIYSIRNDSLFTLKMLDTIKVPNEGYRIDSALYPEQRRAFGTNYTVFTIRQGDFAISHRLTGNSTLNDFTLAEMAQFKPGPVQVEIGSYFAQLNVSSNGVKYYYYINGRKSLRKAIIITKKK